MVRKDMKRESFEVQYEPRTIRDIIAEIFSSNEPFAVAYKNHSASKGGEEAENEQLFEEYHPNTELCVDLKLYTLKQGRMKKDEALVGVIICDGDAHFTFFEKAPEGMKAAVVKRNPCIIAGEYVNIHKGADGTLYPILKRPSYIGHEGFQAFCRNAARELQRLSTLSLVEKMASE